MKHETLAAVDLGSNSFHLVVAAVVDGELRVLDRVKERVRLAAGLDDEGHLDPDSRARALAALGQLGDRIAALPVSRVRAVGTNTLRRAADSEDFLEAAEAALGHPIEIVSGHEEARLVYQGVAHEVEDEGGRRLVVDIGGGSTECVIGDGGHLLRADSLFMGCVGYSERFFGDGVLSSAAMKRAVMAARRELASVQHIYQSIGWDTCYGSSGTIKATQAALLASGWSSHAIKKGGLKKLRKAISSAGSVEALRIPGVSAERIGVIAGGVAVLAGVFSALGIKRMVASDGALREGLLLDLVGQERERDMRDGSVARLRDRFGADVEHAQRVERLALQLLAQADASWSLDAAAGRRRLRWAAQLCEIGKSIDYTGYHKHGAYLVQHSRMAGFSQGDQAMLATLVLCQRRRLTWTRVVGLVGKRKAPEAMRLALLLRLATRLQRLRRPDVPFVELAVTDGTLHLAFPEGWLEDRPLTLADLGEEQVQFRAVGFELTWS